MGGGERLVNKFLRCLETDRPKNKINSSQSVSLSVSAMRPFTEKGESARMLGADNDARKGKGTELPQSFIAQNCT